MQLKDQSTKDSRWIQTVTRHSQITLYPHHYRSVSLLWVKTVSPITWNMYSALKNLNKSNMSVQVLANTTIIVVKNSTTYELLIIGSFNTLRWSFKSSWYLVYCRWWAIMSARQMSVSVLCAVRRRETKADLRDSLSSPDTVVSIVIQTPMEKQSTKPVLQGLCAVLESCQRGLTDNLLFSSTGWFITEMFGARPLIWPAS